jgi:hypothetical protein
MLLQLLLFVRLLHHLKRHLNRCQEILARLLPTQAAPQYRFQPLHLHLKLGLLAFLAVTQLKHSLVKRGRLILMLNRLRQLLRQSLKQN